MGGTMKLSNPVVNYDREVDVLYVAYESAAAARGSETGDGMVRRYAADGALVGITIVDFSEWLRGKAVNR